MSIILFELNETPWRVLDWYVNAHPGSAFARLAARSATYTTVNEDAGELHPWVTWPTLHRGVCNQRHGIAHLGQDLRPVDEEFPAIWRILADQGLTVGVGGSLQSFPAPAASDGYAFYIPDTYALQPDTIPPQLSQFQALNLRLTKQNSRNVSSKLDVGDAATLCAAFSRHGGRASTAGRIIGQLANELVDKARLNRRRGIQAALYFDIFLRQLNTQKPAFCTFFSNHVAAAMHRYWAAAFPQDYVHVDLPPAWLARYSRELEWAMDLADDFLRQLMTFCERNRGYRLVVASSMGQAATQAEARDGYYSVTDVGRFLSCFGLERNEFEPALAMAPDVSVRLLSMDAVDKLRAAQPLLHQAFPDIEVDLEVGGLAHIRLLIPHDVEQPIGRLLIGEARYAPDEVGIGFVPDQDRVGTTAYHVPDGVLLSWRPGSPMRRSQTRPRVSSVEVAPAILKAYGFRRRSYMSEPSFSLV